MAIFRTASKSKGSTFVDRHHEDNKLSANIHDPILTAVNENQPFEEATQVRDRRTSYLSAESGEMKDVFGQKVSNADMLNPTRARNERPLDTIRGFEYAITGDLAYRDQLETQRLGWGFHEDFPHYGLQSRDQEEPQMGGLSRPVAAFGGEQAVYQAGNYSASSLTQDTGKKKKKGLFGRKK